MRVIYSGEPGGFKVSAHQTRQLSSSAFLQHPYFHSPASRKGYYPALLPFFKERAPSSMTRYKYANFKDHRVNIVPE